jgi:FkbM family methyltransferase
MSVCDPNTNGELTFFNKIKDQTKVVFDVGCANESIFLECACEVHYFDPDPSLIERLSARPNKNSTAVFNAVGLGEETKELYYYPMHASFIDRATSCGFSDDANKVMMKIKCAKEYMLENNVTSIDFLKIDVEGYELSVLKGFGDTLACVKYIQFEYGGTYIDSGVKLVDVVNYLTARGFDRFSTLTMKGLVYMTDFSDHYKYSNIVCMRRDQTKK